MGKTTCILFIYSLVFLFSCSSTLLGVYSNQDESDSKDNYIYSNCDILPIKDHATFVMYEDWDLKGKSYRIPEGVTIKGKGGVFKNGKLVGNHTRVDAKIAIFDNIEIVGKWNVPIITTRMFRGLDKPNAIKKIFALTADDVFNTIVIDKGTYFVTSSSFGSAINVKSNVSIELNGNIAMLPNSYRGCSVIEIRNAHNVFMSGRGFVSGDKDSHLGNDGEWGHGINIRNSSNVNITGIKVCSCWGDCLYIGEKSKKIKIVNCKFVKGRRQGISITSANDVCISACLIKDVSGTNPEYAIDIEPNKGDTVTNIKVKKTIVDNCVGGFAIYTGKNNDSYVEHVEYVGCIIKLIGKKHPFFLSRCKTINIRDCKVLDAHPYYIFENEKVEDLTIKRNIFYSYHYVLKDPSNVTFQNNKIYGSNIFPEKTWNLTSNFQLAKIRNNKIIGNEIK